MIVEFYTMNEYLLQIIILMYVIVVIIVAFTGDGGSRYSGIIGGGTGIMVHVYLSIVAVVTVWLLMLVRSNEVK